MHNDILWIEKGNTEKCVQNSITIAKYARKFLGCRWSFLGLGSEKNGMGRIMINQTEIGTEIAEMMMLQLHTESGHSTFRASSAFERGELRSKGHGKKSVHFNGSAENIELTSPHDNFCKSAQCPRSNGRFVQRITKRNRKVGETWSTWSFGNDGNSCWPPHQRTATVKPGAILRAQIRTSVWWPEVIQTMLWRWFEVCPKRTTFLHTDTDGGRMQHLCREYTMPRYEKKTRAKGGILKNTRIGPVLDIQVCRHKDRYCIDVLVESLFQDRTTSWVRIVSGIDKYVTESMEKKEEHRALVRPVAKARRLKPAVTLSAVSIPPHERKYRQRGTWPWLLHGVKSHDTTTTTRSVRSSRRRWSSTIRWYSGGSQEKESRWCFAMVTQRLDIHCGKGRKSQEKVSRLLESKLFQPLPEPQSSSRTFRR